MYPSFEEIGRGVLGGLVAGQVIGWCIALIALFVFNALVRWKLFVKAGEAGWKSIIPIYGDFVEYRIVWAGKYFWIQLSAGAIAGACAAIPFIGPTITVACIIVLSVMKVVFALNEAHAFGKDDGFAIGLMLVGFPFMLMLALDQDVKYVGPQPTPNFFNIT